MSYTWNTPIRYVRGLGPQRTKELAKIGVTTVGELLERKPLSYIYPGVMNIADASEGMVVVKAKVRGINRGWGSTVKAILDDDTDTCQAIWYTSYVAQHLHTGMIATFYGKMKGGVLQQPRWTTVESTLENVYGGQYGTHHDTIRAALKEVLANVELPDIRLETGDSSRVQVFAAFHFPHHKHMLDAAINTLKFDEALTLQLALAEKRWGREGHESVPIGFDASKNRTIQEYFPYAFTLEQHTALGQVVSDMACAHRPMSRLLHGDVGVGKTAVAFYAAMLAALNGKRTLILAPTTILAQQHYDTLKGMGWDDVGLQRTGETFRPNSHIVIGTHNLLNLDYLIAESSLVIIDEFQKFGVEQRAKIQRHHPHLLLLSATPIPRTLAATVFGDLDVSAIRQLPIKRGSVVTRWVLPEKREGMYEIIDKELAAGHQVYIVYPRISRCGHQYLDGEDVASAEQGFRELCKRFKMGTGIDNSIELLTGRDSIEDKARTLKLFREGYVKIFVSTIIAEVGLDNSNATVMVVEGADRFGLSQLHQLRGRVCRSEDTAYCFLVSDTANEKSIARLDVIEKCNCGFEIAEHDLRLRGCGEVFSTKQTGLPDLKFISLLDDFDLIQEAKELVVSGSAGKGPKAMMKMRYEGLLHFGEVV